MAGGGKAVFLSYASEDSEAAARIAEALKAVGVEVWFDRNELRGGDAWDVKIRQQIRECALFMPVISAHTEARDEGYFRREWKLAVDRSDDIAEHRAFLMPVVIDAVAQRVASVSDRFRAVQWAQLPSGHASAEFVNHIARLLAPAELAKPGAGNAATTIASVSNVSRPKRLAWAFAASVGLVVAASGYYWWRGHQQPTARQALANSAATAEVTAAPEAAKSVAVLPFIDMSEKKDQEYLSDGLSEELINLLANVEDLRVPARTSSFFFKNKQATIAEIAKTLRVEHVLEGSVRKSDKTVRIPVQLIRAADGYHVWSDTYERALKDIFKLQDEIAANVVQALKAKLLAGSQRPEGTTTNLDAYSLTLQGRTLLAHANEPDMRLAASRLEEAVALDPNYAPAWVGLSDTNFELYDVGFAPRQEVLPRARAAAEKAVQLAPDFGEAHRVLGWVELYSDYDWTGAQAELDAARRADPSPAEPD